MPKKSEALSPEPENATTVVQANTAAVENRPPVPALVKLEPPQGAVKLRTAALLGTDPDGDKLTLADIDTTSARGGTVTVQGDWVFYQAPGGMTGEDSIGYTVSDARGAVSGGTVSIVLGSGDLALGTRVLTPDPRPETSSETLSPRPERAGVRIADNGIPGRTYSIEFAENPAAPVWQELGSAVADAAGTYEYLDHTSASGSQRIYRARTF